ncbi:MAG: ABC transporter permease [Candidatus Acetothermia bacterium]
MNLEEQDIDLEEELADLKQKQTSQLALAWMRFKRSKLALFGAGIVLGVIIIAIFAPYIAPYPPLEIDILNKSQPPSGAHILGTDMLGLDIFSRMVFGSRIALQIGLLIVAVSGGIGVTLGLLAGAVGGWVDELIMRLVDTFLSFPTLILALAIAGALGPGLYNVIIAVGMIVWTRFARVTRGEILSIKEEKYIEAARASGESRFNIALRYLLPNVLPSIVVVATLQLPAALLASAALSFLGVGAQPPQPSWGYMVSAGRGYLLEAPWISTFPGLAVMITVLGFNFMGDGLRDALNPMTRSGS